LTEGAIGDVGGMGNVEVGVCLIRVQKRQVRRERTVRAPEFAVYAFRFVATRVDNVFFKIVFEINGKLLEERAHLMFCLEAGACRPVLQLASIFGSKPLGFSRTF